MRVLLVVMVLVVGRVVLLGVVVSLVRVLVLVCSSLLVVGLVIGGCFGRVEGEGTIGHTIKGTGGPHHAKMLEGTSERKFWGTPCK